MENLNESCFAYPALRKFPINTKEDAISSFGAYCMQKQAFSPEQQACIEQNFTKAASYYDIKLEVPAEEPVERRVLMLKGASRGVQMTEITSMDELDKAVDFILDKRASVPRAELAEAAKYVLWQASNTDTDMDTDRMRKISHIAGMGVGDRKAIEHEFKKRATLNMLSARDSEAFWKFARELEQLPDSDFYTEANLNRVCDVIDSLDFMYNNQHKHANELGYPEDVVFAETIDDIKRQAEDLLHVPSIDTVLSKKALLERKDAVNGFFDAYFEKNSQKQALEGQELLEKVANLDKNTAIALLEAIDD